MLIKKNRTRAKQATSTKKLFSSEQPLGKRARYYASNLMFDGGMIDVFFNDDESMDYSFDISTPCGNDLLPYLGLIEYARDIYDPHEKKEAVTQALKKNNRYLRRPPIHHNLSELGKKFGLDATDLYILDFLITLKSESGLRMIIESIGDLNYAQKVRVVAVATKIDTAKVRNALQKNSKLLTSGLITVNDDRDYNRELPEYLSLISGLNERIYSENNFQAIINHLVSPAPAAKLVESDFTHLGKVYSDIEQMCRQERPLNILLYGEPGTGKSELVRTIASSLNHALYEVATENEGGYAHSGDDRLCAYLVGQQLLVDQAQNNMLCFDEVEDLFLSTSFFRMFGNNRKSENKGFINQALETPKVTTFWISNEANHIDPAYLRRFDLVVEIKGLTPLMRSKLIRQFTDPLPLSDRWIDTISMNQNLQPAHLERAAESVKSMVMTHSLTQSQLRSESERLMEFVISGTQQAIGNTFSSANAASASTGPEYQLNYLNSNVDLKRLVRGMRVSKQGRICLYGPPGTGKSAFGRYLAEQLRQPLMVRKASDLIDMYVGETEKNIAQMFDEGVRDNAVILIDEGDSFLRSREGASHSWETTQVNELLTQMEAYEGVFILSTNLMDSLDSAALRRFDFKIHLDSMKPDQSWALFRETAKQQSLKRSQVSKVKREVEKIHNLTPGDFATILRRDRVMRSFETIEDLANALKEECSLKPDANQNPIGFI